MGTFSPRTLQRLLESRTQIRCCKAWAKIDSQVVPLHLAGWFFTGEIYEGKPRFPSWWLSFNPFRKYANHQIGSLFLQGSGWTFQKCLKPPPSCHVCILWYLGHMFRASSGPELSEFCLLFFLGVVSLYMTPGPKQCTSQEKEKSLKFIIHLYCLIPPKWVIYWT